jgi:hypothetical protein
MPFAFDLARVTLWTLRCEGRLASFEITFVSHRREGDGDAEWQLATRGRFQLETKH